MEADVGCGDPDFDVGAGDGEFVGWGRWRFAVRLVPHLFRFEVEEAAEGSFELVGNGDGDGAFAVDGHRAGELEVPGDGDGVVAGDWGEGFGGLGCRSGEAGVTAEEGDGAVGFREADGALDAGLAGVRRVAELLDSGGEFRWRLREGEGCGEEPFPEHGVTSLIMCKLFGQFLDDPPSPFGLRGTSPGIVRVG